MKIYIFSLHYSLKICVVREVGFHVITWNSFYFSCFLFFSISTILIYTRCILIVNPKQLFVLYWEPRAWPKIIHVVSSEPKRLFSSWTVFVYLEKGGNEMPNIDGIWVHMPVLCVKNLVKTYYNTNFTHQFRSEFVRETLMLYRKCQ